MELISLSINICLYLSTPCHTQFSLSLCCILGEITYNSAAYKFELNILWRMSPVGTLKLETNICIFLNTDLGASQMAVVVTGYI